MDERLPEAPIDPSRQATEDRYGRPDVDRLSEDFLQRVARRRTAARSAAFFDLDKTIIARSSALVFGRTFLKDGLISTSTVIKGMYAQALYQLQGADHERMEQMRSASLELTRGWEVERVQRLVREAVEEVVAPLVFQEALDLIAEHRRAGRDIWIVSSSADEIVVPFAGYLGITDVIGTQGGVDEDGRYDGTLDFYAYAGNKATAMRQVAEVRGYDLAECFAYSDSITDLPMLTAVGNPVAVNPDRELRAAARAMDWPAHDFRDPVSLRSRLPDVPRPRNEVLVGALTALVAGVLAWRTLSRQPD